MLEAMKDSMTAKAESSEAAFGHFYALEYQGQFHRAFLLLGTSSDADEAVQQAFVAVWTRWDSLQQPGPYLNRCVLNATHSLQRDRQRTRRLAARLTPTEGGQRIDHPNLLTDELALLPFNQRASIVLRYYGGLKDQEIADALDCPLGSVGPWIRRALDQLERRLT